MVYSLNGKCILNDILSGVVSIITADGRVIVVSSMIVSNIILILTYRGGHCLQRTLYIFLVLYISERTTMSLSLYLFDWFIVYRVR